MVEPWERTLVLHLSSCRARHKLGIMNITEVMGLWDSFMTLTNTISQEAWGGRTRETYACLFCIAKRAVEPLHVLFLTSDSPLSHTAWPTLLLRISIFSLCDSACTLRSWQPRQRGCRNVGETCLVWQMTIWAYQLVINEYVFIASW